MFWSESYLGSVYHMISSSCLNLSTNTLQVHIIYKNKMPVKAIASLLSSYFTKYVVAVERDNKIPNVRRVSILIIYYTEILKIQCRR